MRIILLITILFYGFSENNLYAKDTKGNRITILDKLSLDYDKKGGIPFTEISDIAYNQKTKELFMISDKGYLYKFRASFGNKIEQLKYISGFKLRTRKGKRKRFDSEGLTFNGRGQLLVSFDE